MRTPATELPERALRIREALLAAGAHETAATAHADDALLAVHDPALVEFLRTAWDEWAALGLPNDRVVPYVFAREELTSGRPAPKPAAVWARPGRFAYDTMTLIGPGTWEAARAAVDCALTAVDLVVGRRALRVCLLPPARPSRDAVAVRRLVLPEQLGGRRCRAPRASRRAGRDRRHRRAPRQRDAGALPGTRRRADRVGARRPRRGWFPHFLGFADESDESNLNVPVAPASGDEPWLAAVREAAAFASGARALVIALGVDAATADPESPLAVHPRRLRRSGPHPRRRSACRRSSSRRAATTSARSGISWSRRCEGLEEVSDTLGV